MVFHCLFTHSLLYLFSYLPLSISCFCFHYCLDNLLHCCLGDFVILSVPSEVCVCVCVWEVGGRVGMRWRDFGVQGPWVTVTFKLCTTQILKMCLVEFYVACLVPAISSNYKQFQMQVFHLYFHQTNVGRWGLKLMKL